MFGRYRIEFWGSRKVWKAYLKTISFSPKVRYMAEARAKRLMKRLETEQD